MRIKLKINKHKSHKLLKWMILLMFIFLTSSQVLGYIYKNSNISNEDFIMMLLNNEGYGGKKIINNIVKFVSKVDLTDPTTMLYMDTEKTVPVNDNTDNYNYEELSGISKYINDPNPIDITKPRVYIYNSHQLENYNNKDLEVYNITPNVMMASYLLKEKLNNLGIPTIAENTNMSDFMRINAWVQSDSYKASRILILENKSKYDTLEYYIDFHRDSIKKDLTTISIKGKSYARVLFVIGLDNPNYKENLRLATTLSNKLNSLYPKISKGVLKKQGAGVDGLYNQDISPKMMLLEVGGVENTIEEVLNTIEAFSICFNEFIGEYR